MFVDNAQGLIAPPERSPEEVRRALELAMDECLAKGVTSLTDAGAGTDVIALYREQAAAGTLRTRLYVMAAGLPTMRALGPPDPGDGMLAVRAVKLYADGALGSRGAALLEPYSDDPGNSGLLVTPPEGILEAARFALAHGFQVGTHAIGDRANRIVLDAYETALPREPGREGPPLPHRARADPRRRGHPAVREAGRPRRHAGDPLPLRPALGPEAPRRRARRRGGLRVAEAPRHAAPASSTGRTRRSRTCRRSRTSTPRSRGRTRTASRPAASTPTRS